MLIKIGAVQQTNDKGDSCHIRRRSHHQNVKNNNICFGDNSNIQFSIIFRKYLLP